MNYLRRILPIISGTPHDDHEKQSTSQSVEPTEQLGESLQKFWLSRNNRTGSMSLDEFTQIIFIHPEVPLSEVKDIIRKKLLHGQYLFAFGKFESAILLLIKQEQNGIFIGTALEGMSFPVESQELMQSVYHILAQVTHFSEDEVRKLEVDFDRLRGFGTQKITMQTFETLLEGVVHRQLINGIFNAFDDNGDGFVGLMEFVCGFSNLSKGPDAERLKFLAKMLDEDRDGYLTIDDIQRLYKLINLEKELQTLNPTSNQISLFDFVSLVNDNPSLKDKLILIEDDIKTQFMIFSPPSLSRVHSPVPTPTAPIILDGEKPALGGIINLGNTCYISTALESLANVRVLVNMLRSGSISVPKNSVTHIFMDFLETIYSSSAVNPTFIKSSITYKTNLFGDRLQHDCPEFLNVLLDILKMEIDEFIKSQATPNGKQIDEPIEAQPNKNEDSENNSQQSIEIVPAENEKSMAVDCVNPISHLFDSQLRSRLQCLDCGHSSSSTDLFTMLQLPIPIDDRSLVTIIAIDQSKKYSFMVPKEMKVEDFKPHVCSKIGIAGERLKLVIVDKINKQIIQLSDHPEFGSMQDLPLAHIDICCFDADSENFVNFTCLHRRHKYKMNHVIRGLDGINTEIFGLPLNLPFPKARISELNGVALYFTVFEKVRKLFPEKNHQQNQNGSRNRALDADENACSGYPFELSFTRDDATWCPNCSWKKFCRGCLINPEGTEPLHLDLELLSHCFLTINWKPIAFYMLSSGQYFEFNTVFDNDQSVEECEHKISRCPSLSECLNEFTNAERIDDSKCEKCGSIGRQDRTLRISSLGKVLIFHLKRFIYVPSLKRFVKCTKPVTFPLDDFDPSPYMDVVGEEKTDEQQNGSESPPVRYKCTAIVNHNGQLNYGHYTTHIRDNITGRWVFYNDTHWKVDSDDFRTHDAYLLFYEAMN